MTLPSGRALAYQEARLARVLQRTSIKYKGQNQTTQKWEEIDTYGGKITENITQAVHLAVLGGGLVRSYGLGDLLEELRPRYRLVFPFGIWEEIDTYGGKITENITQAVARDCLGAAMLRLDKAGYRP